MKYVIAGGGPASIGAIESIREVDKSGEILLITDEKYAGYSRPLITYLLGRKVTEDKMYYRTPDFFEKNKVNLITEKRVVRLNEKEKFIILEDNQKIDFDKLLIATGGKPFVPPIKGYKPSMDGIFTFTKWEDEIAIDNYIKENNIKSAIVLGGGLIGLKTTEALLELNIKVTIVELADRILAATFDKKASDIITKALHKQGCEVFTEDTIVEIKGKKRIEKVKLKSGKIIQTNLLIIAIGVRPNIDFLKDTEIKINKGIIVNDYMETNIKDIYSAGDCAEGKEILTGTFRPIAILPVAYEQGSVAGYNMAGKKVEYQGGIPMNSVELAGIPTISAGMTETDGAEIIEKYEPEKNIYKKLVIKDNRLIGAVFVTEIDRAGIYTNLIRNKTDVSSFKKFLLNEDFGLIYLPKEYRKKMFEKEIAVWMD